MPRDDDLLQATFVLYHKCILEDSVFDARRFLLLFIGASKFTSAQVPMHSSTATTATTYLKPQT
jgi:hypothetical protein